MDYRCYKRLQDLRAAIIAADLHTASALIDEFVDLADDDAERCLLKAHQLGERLCRKDALGDGGYEAERGRILEAIRAGLEEAFDHATDDVGADLQPTRCPVCAHLCESSREPCCHLMALVTDDEFECIVGTALESYFALSNLLHDQWDHFTLLLSYSTSICPPSVSLLWRHDGHVLLFTESGGIAVEQDGECGWLFAEQPTKLDRAMRATLRGAKEWLQEQHTTARTQVPLAELPRWRSFGQFLADIKIKP